MKARRWCGREISCCSIEGKAGIDQTLDDARAPGLKEGL